MSPLALPVALMPVNPETGAALSQPVSLPSHLQHAVYMALSDLQASRLLYPQQCAAAEAAVGDERPAAERWVLRFLLFRR